MIAASCVLIELINQQPVVRVRVCVFVASTALASEDRRRLASQFILLRASVAPQHKINSALDSLFYANIKLQMITMTCTFLLALGHDRKVRV